MKAERPFWKKHTADAPNTTPEQQEPPRGTQHRRPHSEALEWLRSLAIAFVVAIFITQVVIVNAKVPSSSMEETIMAGDRVLGLRFAYWFNEPERYDIAIFKFPDDESQLYVKRVIGLPGETVTIREGQVYIDESAVPLDSHFVNGEPEGDFGPYHVPLGHYLMLGDNRNNSNDSRYWLSGPYLAADKIVGKASLRLFPNPGKLE